MDWFQFFTLIGTILGAAGFLFKEMKSFEAEIRSDVKQQSARTDKLYEMFINLLQGK